MHTKKPLLASLGLGLLLGLPATVAVASGATTSVSVYTPVELRGDLARDPKAWLDRTVLVRGAAAGALGVTHAMPTFVTGKEIALPAALGLDWGPENPFWKVMRRLPLVGAVAPAPQAVRWNVEAVYRVQLRALSGSFICPTGPCYEAILLDAAPGGGGRPLPSTWPPALPVMPIRPWRGPVRVAPLIPYRGRMRVVPLPYRPPSYAPLRDSSGANGGPSQ